MTIDDLRISTKRPGQALAEARWDRVMQHMLNDARGRSFLYWLLGLSGYRDINRGADAFVEGRRSIGLEVEALIRAIDPDILGTIEKEARRLENECRAADSSD